MIGIQFLTDAKGNKTSAIIDLKEHSQFWTDVLAECGEPNEFQFLINEQGQKVAVILDFSKHGELWEDLYFGLTTDEVEDEPSLPWENVKQELESNRKLSV